MKLATQVGYNRHTCSFLMPKSNRLLLTIGVTEYAYLAKTNDNNGERSTVPVDQCYPVYPTLKCNINLYFHTHGAQKSIEILTFRCSC